jgi:hypothetical protein
VIKREKIRLVNGKPLICAFDSLRGKAVRSPATGHVEYLYNVQHRGAPAMIFLPTEGVQALQRVQAEVGEDLHILKTLAKDQPPQVTIRRLRDGTLAIPALPPMPPQKRLGKTSIAYRQREPQKQPDRFVQYMQQQPPPPTAHELSTGVLLATCLHCAIDAVIGAERFAASKGRELIFLSDDIRAMAITIYIGKR